MSKVQRHERKVDIFLPKLGDQESVDLVLYHTHREITKDDFLSEEILNNSVKK